MPTSTVEDYLKCILTLQDDSDGSLVTMGEIAGALDVAPGTVTAMMKTLSESGLVSYEPYSGVRLTEAGSKLALHVLRRHRLIELFLVQVMKLDWSEVHAEAELLEHAVSDRLIDAMDKMLGFPKVDPHGDPIPDKGGVLAAVKAPTLLGCPVQRPVRVVRVGDQNADFLRLIESSGLTPGSVVEVASRDKAADRVELIVGEGGDPDQRLSLGFRAASKVLVEEVPVG